MGPSIVEETDVVKELSHHTDSEAYYYHRRRSLESLKEGGSYALAAAQAHATLALAAATKESTGAMTTLLGRRYQ